MLDLMKAYHHIHLDKESRPLTLTMTPLGPQQYVKLPLGLKDSGAIFQCVIQQTLQDGPGIIPYVDDILVSAKRRRNMTRTWKSVSAAYMRRISNSSSLSAIFGSLKFHFLAESFLALSYI